MLVFLVGYMGSGKSTLGAGLARRLGFAHIDMDRRIEEQQGMSVNRIFAEQGQDAFRAMERALLERIAASEGDAVVSTGGGAPCRGDNMELMNGAGVTVYLKMSPRRLLQRLAHGRDKRPLIKDMDDGQLLEFIGRNLGEREPYYARARMVIDCDGVSDEYVLDHIEAMVSAKSPCT